MNKYYNHQGYCLCGNKECFDMQRKLSRYKGPTPQGDEWCKPTMPIKISFNARTANYRTWLLVLSICYHVPCFLATAFRTFDLPKRGGRDQWSINKIHFPRALLENRLKKKFGLSQNTSIMSPGVARHLESLDGGRNKLQMADTTNTSGFLEEYAERVLLAPVFQQFQKSKSRRNGRIPKDYLVQAPLVSLDDVKGYFTLLKQATHLLPGSRNLAVKKNAAKSHHCPNQTIGPISRRTCNLQW